ncbi:hypothetical protein OGAPHI_004144 [Ogataea philodendri]|uniref:Uncharacterized protein n=1 Tax=Ogataea philodendri TaxID=1378263 RepID=A0A9P8P661_9ASCO|nr:uncharacterized protein OGAPHI_004144 [Ogataea philodendri]KAH3665955.1 hypothetical protein OGAPHI_004144 [Ogataea philodendri]
MDEMDPKPWRCILDALGGDLETGWSQTKSHGTSHFLLINFRHVDNTCLFLSHLRNEFGTGGTVNTQNVSKELDHSNLQSQTHTKVWNVVLSGPFGSSNHSLNTSSSKSTWNQDSICFANQLPCGMEVGFIIDLCLWFQVSRLDPNNLQLSRASHCTVFKRLDHRQVRIVQVCVLSNDCNRDFLERSIVLGGKFNPILVKFLTLFDHIKRNVHLSKLQSLAQVLNHFLFFQKQWNVVGRVDVMNCQNLLSSNMAEHSNLLNCWTFKFSQTSATDHIRRQPKGSEIFDSSLSWLGLLLSVDHRNQ